MEPAAHVPAIVQPSHSSQISVGLSAADIEDAMSGKPLLDEIFLDQEQILQVRRKRRP